MCNGIKQQTSAPYTPEQNGKAERDHRTTVESARSMIHHNEIPIYLWAEAVNHAVYVLNRFLTANTTITPFEIWHKRKPDLTNLRIFGSVTWHPSQIGKNWIPKPKKESMLAKVRARRQAESILNRRERSSSADISKYMKTRQTTVMEKSTEKNRKIVIKMKFELLPMWEARVPLKENQFHFSTH